MAQFASHAIQFNGGRRAEIPLSSLNGRENLSIALWFQTPGSGWYGGTRSVFLSRNQANQRQLAIVANPRGGLGELEIGFAGDPTGSLALSYLPDNTFSHLYWQCFGVAKQGTTVKAYRNGAPVAVSGGVAPLVLSTVSDPLVVGSTLTGSSPNGGLLCGLFVWLRPLTDADWAEIWDFGAGEPGNPKTMRARIRPNHAYMLGTGDALPVVTDRIGGVHGTYVGAVAKTTDVPTTRRLGPDRVARYRFRINDARETWASAFYTAFPTMVRLSPTSLLIAYQRASDHVGSDARSVIVRSRNNGKTWPYAQRPWPGLPDTETVLLDTPEADRGGCLSMPRGPGTRLFLHGQTVEVTAPVNPVRSTWIMHTDPPYSTWSPSRSLIVQGTQWTTTGLARIIAVKGGLLVPYFWRDLGENRYTCSVAFSTNGDTWVRRSDIARAPEPSGLQYEEPCIGRLLDGRIMSLIREDTDELIYQNFTADDGHTWTPLTVAFPGVGKPEWLQLSNGCIIVATRGVDQPVGQGVLFWSWDGAKTWNGPIDFQDPAQGAYEYCGMIEHSPGVLAIAYGQERLGAEFQRSMIDFAIIEPRVFEPGRSVASGVVPTDILSPASVLTARKT